MRRLILPLLCCTMAVSAWAQSTARKFTLSNSSDGESTLTVYLPSQDKANGMAVLDCPGGGYSHLAMDHEGHDWAEYYNQQGIALAVLKYRMPKGDRNIPLSDAYHAMKVLRDSAVVWNLNPHAIGIQGFSAGGHLASSVSTHAAFEVRPDFSILFYPVVSMDQRESHRGSCTNFLGEGVNDKKLIDEWSNHKAVRRHLTPPAIIITANDDRTVPPVTNGIAYYSAMRRNGNDCALYVYPTGGHGFGIRSTWKHHKQMLTDLSTWLSELNLPQPDDKKIACIGNSITDGHGIDMCDLYGYPALLEQRLGKGYDVRNFGVSARTMLNKGDHPYMNELAWRDCLAWQPDVAIIKLGTNDSKVDHRPFLDTDFRKDMQQMLDSLHALPTHPRIFLCSPIPAYKDSWTISDSVIVGKIIPMVKEMAEQNGCDFIDLHSLFSNTDGSMMQSDGIHPSQKGVEQMAQIIDNALRNAPAAKPTAKTTKKTKKKGKN
ncbi:MAG: alpha/beta hydrolase fold domain-containing protein [Bacteroidales bacterium]|nr:alpha/beta hydrolase fold domain-containing protein [Bacteroidales bacterium]